MSDINDISRQERELRSSLREQMAAEEDKLQPTDLTQIAQSEMTKQANRRLEQWRLDKQTLIDEYNMKTSIINTTMDWMKMDYNQAVDQYNRDFNEKMILMQMVEGRIDDAEKEANAQKDSANANLTFIQNTMIANGKTWADLDGTQQAMISKLELQGGMEQGITQAFMNEKPDAEVLATTTGYDSAGNQFVNFIYKDADGKAGIVETVYTGGYKKPTTITEGTKLGLTSDQSKKISKDFDSLWDRALEGEFGIEGSREKIINELAAMNPNIDKNIIASLVYGDPDKGISAALPDGYEETLRGRGMTDERIGIIVYAYLKTMTKRKLRKLIEGGTIIVNNKEITLTDEEKQKFLNTI